MHMKHIGMARWQSLSTERSAIRVLRHKDRASHSRLRANRSTTAPYFGPSYTYVNYAEFVFASDIFMSNYQKL